MLLLPASTAARNSIGSPTVFHRAPCQQTDILSTNPTHKALEVCLPSCEQVQCELTAAVESSWADSHEIEPFLKVYCIREQHMVGMRDIDASFLQHERMCDGESALPGAKPRHLSDTHKGIAISTRPGVLASAVRVLRIPCMVCRRAVWCGTCFGQHPPGVVDV